jgi:hypothetical protein
MATIDIRGATLSASDPAIATNPNPDLAIKAPVRAATTGSNIVLSGLQTIDGVALAAGDRVLAKDQADATTNGLYNAATGPWTRTIDAINNSQWATGTQVLVTAGAVNTNVSYVLTAANPVVLGTTTMTFTDEVASFLVFPINNSVPAITLTTPDSTSATWDNQALAALYINPPPNPTTRNFLAGIWVETNGATTDKGRGIGIHNVGASDSLYIQLDGAGCTGFAVLAQTDAANATGGVIGTTLSTQLGLNIRQETDLVAGASSASLLQLDANGATTEMLRVNSSVASQVGAIFRMTGANSTPIAVQNAAGADVFVVNNAGAAQLGLSGTAGSLIFGNATSGLLTLQPIGGALGSNTLSLPAATDTLVGRATTDTLTNKTISGSGNTLTVLAGSQLSGQVPTVNGGTGLATLTAHAVILGEGTGNVGFATIGTAGRILIDQGAAADPSFSVVSGDAALSAAGALTVTKTNGTAFGALATLGVGTGLTSSGGNLNLSTPVSLANGGTNASLTASNGGIFYSTGSAGAILAATATANQMLMSGASAAPVWSTSTWPTDVSASGQVLVSSGAHAWSASGSPSLSGTVTAAAFVPNGTAVPSGLGMYEVNSITLGFATQGQLSLQFTNSLMTFGTGTGNACFAFNGGNSGTNAGAFIALENAGVEIGAIGNLSAIAGTAYDNQITIYGANGIKLYTGATYLTLNTSGALGLPAYTTAGILQNNTSGAVSTNTSSNQATAIYATDFFSNDATYFHQSNATLTNGAASSTGTLTNAPAAGNPTKWIAINDNGTKRQIPAW